MALIEVSSFPAVDAVYLQPATYLAPAAALLSTWALFAVIRERYGPASSRSPTA
jgi:hypothetical protein